MARTKFANSYLSLVVSIFVLGTVAFLTLWAYATSRYGWKVYLEIFSHFQLQYFVLCLILLGILVLLKQKRFIVLGFFCCALLSAQILPWYLPANGLIFSGSKSDLRVLIANINTQNKSYQKVLDLIRLEKPDLAVFMEVDQAWQDQLDTLSDLLPYSSGQTNPYNLGLLVYS
ncbi:endonuclease/exonuclease/phosphatase family protein, partial [Leptolyngbya cf. ectocarpi LEGE 11479]